MENMVKLPILIFLSLISQSYFNIYNYVFKQNKCTTADTVTKTAEYKNKIVHCTVCTHCEDSFHTGI